MFYYRMTDAGVQEDAIYDAKLELFSAEEIATSAMLFWAAEHTRQSGFFTPESRPFGSRFNLEDIRWGIKKGWFEAVPKAVAVLLSLKGFHDAG